MFLFLFVLFIYLFRHCLHSWIQHHVSKPTCPICRDPISPSPDDKNGNKNKIKTNKNVYEK